MRMFVFMLILLASACSARDCNPGISAEDFAGENLLLNKYMTEKCFNLVKCDDSSCTQTVYTFSDGDRFMVNEGWPWEYLPPNLYIVDEYELDVYHSVKEEDCWEVEAFALNFRAEACPCPYLPLVDKNLP